MKKYYLLSLLFVLGCCFVAEAGNPDRQGQAGAYELLLNPWARSSGFAGMNTSSIEGVESMRVNVAGLAYVEGTELVFSRSNYLEGTGVNLNALGFGQKIGEKGVVGISLMSVTFGEIDITTTDSPEGIGATYKPSFFNIGLAYSHLFSERISGGLAVRLVSESSPGASSQGFAIDAGIQYRTNNFDFGISLRNIGAPMRYKGDALTFTGFSPPSNSEPLEGNSPFAVNLRPAHFELPSTLKIGAAYHIRITENLHRVSILGNFTSNSFSKDQYGGGLEYSFKEFFMIRGAYQYEDGLLDEETRTNVHTGISAGASVMIPVKKGSQTKLGVDYSYQTSNPFNGTHTFGVRINL